MTNKKSARGERPKRLFLVNYLTLILGSAFVAAEQIGVGHRLHVFDLVIKGQRFGYFDSWDSNTATEAKYCEDGDTFFHVFSP